MAGPLRSPRSATPSTSRRAWRRWPRELDVELATSTRLAERAAIDLGAFDERRIEIRGRRRPLRVRLVPDARALPVEIAATGRPSTPDFARLLGLGRGMGRPAP